MGGLVSRWRNVRQNAQEMKCRMQSVHDSMPDANTSNTHMVQSGVTWPITHVNLRKDQADTQSLGRMVSIFYTFKTASVDETHQMLFSRGLSSLSQNSFIAH